MMKTLKVGNRSFSMKIVRTFSPAEGGFDQERLSKKYPKAMSALAILTLAHQANPLKSLLAIASGKRQYDERTTEKFLADAEKFISSLESSSHLFSEIKSDEDFREYAHRVMKAAHGEDYSEEVTNKVVDDLLSDNEGADYGELIGRLTSGFGDKSFADNWNISELPINKVFKKVNIQKGLYDAIMEYTKSVISQGVKDILEVNLNANGFQLVISTNNNRGIIWTVGYVDLVKYLGEHYGFTAAAKRVK